jgi:mercuric ion transport protein
MSGLTEPDLPSLEPGDSRQESLGKRLLVLAVIASFAASTCCVLPLLLVLVGITGAWMTSLTSLEPVTPIFTAIALAALAWAGYLIFRPATECVTEGEACARTKPITKRIFIVCALFVALPLLFQLVAPYFY